MTYCVLVAAGSGERAGLGYNKVFYPLAGRSVLSRSLDALGKSGRIDGVVLVISESDAERYAALKLAEGRSPLVLKVVYGGETRFHSVLNGLNALPGDADTVLVHDAARPFVTPEIIAGVISDAEKYGSGVISCPVTDTIKHVDGEKVSTMERSKLFAVQTPQAFNARMLTDAYGAADPSKGFTDDAAVFEAAYGSVHLTRADSARGNIKLTTREDLEMAELRFSAECRVGMGYDAHRLEEGRKLILCGADIPFEKGLVGHSDADVALHALMDALLGAAALGDIGKHFPDSDPQYKDISSLELLSRVRRLLERNGFAAGNADVTIVCQRPKLAPFMRAMRENIAEALGVDIDCVSVKATTTEGMGFEGAGEGISAQAVALVRGTR